MHPFCIQVSQGGYGTMNLLDHPDLSALHRDTKHIEGFSGTTALHSALHCDRTASPTPFRDH